MRHLKVYLNSIGDNASRDNYRTALRDFLRPHLDELSEDSKNRFEINPLRILDSKDPKDQEFCRNAPSILDYLNAESQQYFAEVKGCLDKINIPYEINSSLVRGLDYYNQTCLKWFPRISALKIASAAAAATTDLLKQWGGPISPASALERVSNVSSKRCCAKKSLYQKLQALSFTSSR